MRISDIQDTPCKPFKFPFKYKLKIDILLSFVFVDNPTYYKSEITTGIIMFPAVSIESLNLYSM